jgi:hypothetical protein
MSNSWQAGESIDASTTDRYVSTVEWGEFAMPQFLCLTTTPPHLAYLLVHQLFPTASDFD